MKYIKYLGFASLLLLLAQCSHKPTYVMIETDYGNMKVMLYDSTPGHKENFVKLVNDKFYDGLLFHRIISGFMIQGGDPNSRGASAGARLGGGGPGYQIPAEIGAPHFKGTLAAARTGDGGNPERKSSGSQFYIVQGRSVSGASLDQIEKRQKIKYSKEDRARYAKVGGTPMLDNQYTVFGEVVEGMDVIDKIANVQTAPGDRPVKDVTMKITIAK